MILRFFVSRFLTVTLSIGMFINSSGASTSSASGGDDDDHDTCPPPATIAAGYDGDDEDDDSPYGLAIVRQPCHAMPHKNRRPSLHGVEASLASHYHTVTESMVSVEASESRRTLPGRLSHNGMGGARDTVSGETVAWLQGEECASAPAPSKRSGAADAVPPLDLARRFAEAAMRAPATESDALAAPRMTARRPLAPPPSSSEASPQSNRREALRVLCDAAASPPSRLGPTLATSSRTTHDRVCKLNVSTFDQDKHTRRTRLGLEGLTYRSAGTVSGYADSSAEPENIVGFASRDRGATAASPRSARTMAAHSASPPSSTSHCKPLLFEQSTSARMRSEVRDVISAHANPCIATHPASAEPATSFGDLQVVTASPEQHRARTLPLVPERARRTTLTSHTTEVTPRSDVVPLPSIARAPKDS